jgi:hypothetical protein
MAQTCKTLSLTYASVQRNTTKVSVCDRLRPQPPQQWIILTESWCRVVYSQMVQVTLQQSRQWMLCVMVRKYTYRCHNILLHRRFCLMQIFYERYNGHFHPYKCKTTYTAFCTALPRQWTLIRPYRTDYGYFTLRQEREIHELPRKFLY